MSQTVQELREIFGLTEPDCGELLRAAAEHYSNGDLANASVILAGLLVVTDDIRPRKMLASILFEKHRHNEAEKLYEDIHSRDPKDPYILVALAELKLKRMAFSEALPLFEKLFALDPLGRNPAANRGRSLVHEYRQKLQGDGS